jgi:DNA-binding transcriptional LysR family regulator
LFEVLAPANRYGFATREGFYIIWPAAGNLSQTVRAVRDWIIANS